MNKEMGKLLATILFVCIYIPSCNLATHARIDDGNTQLMDIMIYNLAYLLNK